MYSSPRCVGFRLQKPFLFNYGLEKNIAHGRISNELSSDEVALEQIRYGRRASEHFHVTVLLKWKSVSNILIRIGYEAQKVTGILLPVLIAAVNSSRRVWRQLVRPVRGQGVGSQILTPTILYLAP